MDRRGEGGVSLGATPKKHTTITLGLRGYVDFSVFSASIAEDILGFIDKAFS